MKKTVALLLSLSLAVGLLTACTAGKSTPASSAAKPAASVSTSGDTAPAASASTSGDTAPAASASASGDTAPAASASSSGNTTPEETGQEADSSAAAVKVPEVKDILVKHVAYLTDHSDDYDEYQVVYYGKDTHTLKALSDEVHFKKSAGYTVDVLKKHDINKTYPNFTSMDFATSNITDDGDYISFVCRFDKLDQAENLRVMHENKIIQLLRPGQLVNADSYINWLEKKGATEVPDTDYDKIGLHFS